MNRRKFLRNSALAAVPVIFNGVNVIAENSITDSFLQNLAKGTSSCGKILVIIQLNGGNDGLNTVIPMDQYTGLTAARSNIMLPATAPLILNTSTQTGLHPSMSAMYQMYQNGKLAVVQGVSYPNPNFSHFFAQDIWFSASMTNSDTGWLGRGMDINYPNYPNGYPTLQDPDPPAIQLNGATSLALQGANVNFGYNAPNPASLINVVNSNPGSIPNSDYGTELGFLRLMKDQSNVYATKITTAYNSQLTLSTLYPSSNSLADQLKIVARLIGGGLQTPVYIVNHQNSFDTHSSQVVVGNTTTGNHANMLSRLSEAINAFQNDIELMGKDDKVTGMTYSEFGRRVKSNASNGTDHGTAAPVFFFGSKINSGIYGANAVIPSNPTTNTQVPLEFDFRQLYATVMQDWMCMSATETQSVLSGTYNTLGIFNTSLGLEGITLTGTVGMQQYILNFEAQNNEQFQKFIIEHSYDAKNFNKVDQVEAKDYYRTYSYTEQFDKNRSEYNYYRIVGFMKNGSMIYSNVCKLVTQQKQRFSVYPNPVINHTFTINFFEVSNANFEINIYATNGSKLYYNQLPSKNQVTIQVPDMFDSGVPYLLQIVIDGEHFTEKITFE